MVLLDSKVLFKKDYLMVLTCMHVYLFPHFWTVMRYFYWQECFINCFSKGISSVCNTFKLRTLQNAIEYDSDDFCKYIISTFQEKVDGNLVMVRPYSNYSDFNTRYLADRKVLMSPLFLCKSFFMDLPKEQYRNDGLTMLCYVFHESCWINRGRLLLLLIWSSPVIHFCWIIFTPQWIG